jgi:hypothetical protein
VKEEVDPAEIEYLADRAVTELIDDAKSGRFDTNHELADIIKTRIRKTGKNQLEIVASFNSPSRHPAPRFPLFLMTCVI